MSESVIYKTTTSQTPDILLQDALHIELQANKEDDLTKTPSALTERFEFIRKIGKGSQGQVWLAIRRSDGEKVAIKQFNIHSVTTWKQYELFNREAKILESIDIPGVVPFYEYVEDLEGKPPYVCIVQKYIEGKTLAEHIRSKYRFETEVIYDFIVQVLKILRQLHEHRPQVIHRDIKPSNLMLTPTDNGRFKVTLLDFGAVANPQVQKGGSTVAGTFGYMPPEQLMGKAGPASDIYALAAVAVELLSGVSPADIEVVDFKLVIEPYLQHLPGEVVQTLNMMLEPALDNRICDYSALIVQFMELAEKKKTSFLSRLRRTAIPELSDVESICQPGNYEIWQNLDADKARPVIQQMLAKATQDMAKNKLNISKRIYIIPRVVQILSCILCLFIPLSSNLTGGMVVIFVLVPFFVLLSIAIRMGSIASERKTYYRDLKQLLDSIGNVEANALNASADLNQINDLIRNGQRIVGRIVHIQFESTPYHLVKAIYLNSGNNVEKHNSEIKFDQEYRNSNHHNNLYSTFDSSNTDNDVEPENEKPHLFGLSDPCFTVIYTFQIKHHEKLYEFTGKLITHVPPEDNYKVGDPLTLTAIFQNEGAHRFLLKVMPYPYPFDEVQNLDHLIFRQIIPREIYELPDADSRYETIRSKVINQDFFSVDLRSQEAELLLCLWYSKSRDSLAQLMFELGNVYLSMFKKNKYHDKAISIIETAIHDYMIAASLGNTEGWKYLGNCVLKNELPQLPMMLMATQQKAQETAKTLFQMAFQGGCVVAALDLAKMALNRNDSAEALDWYEKAAEVGNSEGAIEAAKLCVLKYKTDNSKQDLEKAISLYEIAAKHGYKEAMVGIGYIYIYYLNNYEFGLIWYAKAIKAGESSQTLDLKMQFLGLKLEHHEKNKNHIYSVDPSSPVGYTDYTKMYCLKAEYLFNIYELSRLYLNIGYYRYNNAIEYIYALAIACLNCDNLGHDLLSLNVDALNVNHPVYCHDCTDLYELVLEIKSQQITSIDARRRLAEFLFEKTAKFGNEKGIAGLTDLGNLHVKNKNYEAAERIFLKAVHFGDTTAAVQLISLARHYRINNTTLLDVVLLFQKINKLEFSFFLVDIGDIYMEIFDDYDNAEVSYIRAVELGISSAACRLIDLGTLYASKLKNKHKARELYLKAANYWELKDVLQTIQNSEKKIKLTQLCSMVIKGQQKRYVDLANLYKNDLKNYPKAYKYFLFVDEWMREDGSRTERKDTKTSFDYSGFNTMLDSNLSELGDIYQNELENYEGALTLYMKASEYQKLKSFGLAMEDKKNYDLAKQAYESASYLGDETSGPLLINLGDRFVYELNDYDKAIEVYESAIRLNEINAVCNLILLADLYQSDLNDTVRATELQNRALDLFKTQLEVLSNSVNENNIHRRIYEEFITAGLRYAQKNNLNLAQKAYHFAVNYGAMAFETDMLKKRIDWLKMQTHDSK